MSNASEVCNCYICGAAAREERVLVKIRTAMNYCRVSRATLYRWMRDGQIEWVSLPHGRRIYLDSLLRERPMFGTANRAASVSERAAQAAPTCAGSAPVRPKC